MKCIHESSIAVILGALAAILVRTVIINIFKKIAFEYRSMIKGYNSVNRLFSCSYYHQSSSQLDSLLKERTFSRILDSSHCMGF